MYTAFAAAPPPSAALQRQPSGQLQRQPSGSLLRQSSGSLRPQTSGTLRPQGSGSLVATVAARRPRTSVAAAASSDGSGLGGALPQQASDAFLAQDQARLTGVHPAPQPAAVQGAVAHLGAQSQTAADPSELDAMLETSVEGLRWGGSAGRRCC
jgi:hypothetical protein